MCESSVYVAEGDGEVLLMESVAWLEPRGESVLLRDLMGREKEVEGHIQYADLVQHRIVLTSAAYDG